MSIAFITTPFAHVQLKSGRLLVKLPEVDEKGRSRVQSIPLKSLERLVLNEQVQITTQAIASLLRQNAAIYFQDKKGRTIGAARSPEKASSRTRLKQYQRAQDPHFSLTIARKLIAAKIHNQRRLIQKSALNRQVAIDTALDKMEQAQTECEKAESIERLLGVEGSRAALFFQEWARFLPPDFPFERRSTRPPQNAVNACLSYTSALLYFELTDRLRFHGLDPGLGHLHSIEDSRWSLSLDLMEPFRPAIVEAHVLRLFALRILANVDFDARDGGVFLNNKGKQKFFAQYEQRMQREFLSEHEGHRTSLRRLLDAAAVNYKIALEESERFNPFRLN